jgi:flavin reductase (DIM6/NTAB) family NADH-FMN oxidoreductase RutF
MSSETRVVGPVPKGADAEEYDRLRRRVLWAMPSGLFLLGSRSGERRNLMTLNWATQVAFEPKLVAVSVQRSAVTHELVSEGGVFSLCILDRADRALVRKFVKPAALDPSARTLNGLGFHERATGAPVLDQSLAYLDCAVRHTIELGGHTLFLGEVLDAGFVRGEGGEPLRMEDTRMSYGG